MVAGMLTMMFQQLDQPEEVWIEVLSETPLETQAQISKVLGVMQSALQKVGTETS